MYTNSHFCYFYTKESLGFLANIEKLNGWPHETPVQTDIVFYRVYFARNPIKNTKFRDPMFQKTRDIFQVRRYESIFEESHRLKMLLPAQNFGLGLRLVENYKEPVEYFSSVNFLKDLSVPMLWDLLQYVPIYCKYHWQNIRFSALP